VADARCIWFSLDTLQNFLCNIKYYSNKLGIGNSRLGVRIYYGMYNNSHGNYSGLHTLFMTPTFSNDIGSVNTDFDPRYTVEHRDPSDPNNYWTLERLLDVPISGMDLPLTLLGNPSPENPNLNARNSGDLCPPPKSCNDLVFKKIDQ
jgi:hypothetical protein